MRTLRCTGVESEHDLPFAGLEQLFRPVHGLVGGSPCLQAAALRSAFGLSSDRVDDRLLVGLATLPPGPCGAAVSGTGVREAPLLAGLAKVQGRPGGAQMMPFRIGADASCTDGACGQVSRIVQNARQWTRE